MSVKSPQLDLPAGLRGGAEAWDTPQSSAILADDWFAAAAPSTQTLTPARFDNAATFYAATVSQSGGGQTLTPARFDNAQTFYGPTVLRGAVTLTAARFNNAQTFYAPTVSRGAVMLTPARVNNAQTFFAATVNNGGDAPAIAGGHYGAWWANKYREMWERKPKPPTLEEVIEYVEEEPEQAAAVVRELAPSSIGPQVTTAQILANVALQRVIAEQLVIAAQLQQIRIEREADEDDIETILLMI